MANLDTALFRHLYGGPHPNSALLAVMIALTVVGGGWGLLALVPFFATKQARRFAAILLATVVVNAIAVALLKTIVARTRPYLALGVVPLYQAPHDFSFPSGHAAGCFAVAAFALHAWHDRRRGAHSRAAWTGTFARVGIGATILFAIAVAFSRVYLGVHYPGDVIGGAALGSFAGWIGGGAYRRG